MTAICFVPKFNAKGKRDVTGAFLPAAQMWAKYHGGKMVTVDNSLPFATRKFQVLEALEAMPPRFLRVAFFCHGWEKGIQLGFTLKDVGTLAAAFQRHTDDGVQITIFGCLTGSGVEKEAPGGDGGFADELRDALCRAGLARCRVDAHTTAGHATENPHVRRFDGLGSPVGGSGGQWIVAPKSGLWSKWRQKLKLEDKSKLWMRFSNMDIGSIHQELLG